MSIAGEETARNSNPFRTRPVSLMPTYKKKRVDDDDGHFEKNTNPRMIHYNTQLIILR
jgi:hypothetical protein